MNVTFYLTLSSIPNTPESSNSKLSTSLNDNVYWSNDGVSLLVFIGYGVLATYYDNVLECCGGGVIDDCNVGIIGYCYGIDYAGYECYYWSVGNYYYN